MEKRNRRGRTDAADLTDTFRSEGRGHIKSDVQGSYTGLTENYEDPVQDADDL